MKRDVLFWFGLFLLAWVVLLVIAWPFSPTARAMAKSFDTQRVKDVAAHQFTDSVRYFKDAKTGLCFASVTETESWSNSTEGMGGRTTRSVTNVPCSALAAAETKP